MKEQAGTEKAGCIVTGNSANSKRNAAVNNEVSLGMQNAGSRLGGKNEQRKQRKEEAHLSRPIGTEGKMDKKYPGDFAV